MRREGRTLSVSAFELTANERMVSIYQTRTGIKSLPDVSLSVSFASWLLLPDRTKNVSFARGRNEFANARLLQVLRVWLVEYTEADHEQLFPLLVRDEIRGSTLKVCRKEDMIITSMDLTSSAKIVSPRLQRVSVFRQMLDNRENEIYQPLDTHDQGLGASEEGHHERWRAVLCSRQVRRSRFSSFQLALTMAVLWCAVLGLFLYDRGRVRMLLTSLGYDFSIIWR